MTAPFSGCLSCDACRSDCFVQRTTGRLHPSRLVRTAGLGLRDELLRSREIWYCVQCLRCTNGCPSQLAPASHIRAWRAEALRLGLVDLEWLQRYEELGRQLQRARARLIADCVLGDAAVERLVADWQTLDAAPEPLPVEAIPIDPAAAAHALERDIEGLHAVPHALTACLSCRECATVCPAASDGSVYDPVKLFRMVRLGLVDELLRTPAIWLCLACGRCTSVCAQGVCGDRIVASVQELAIRRGAVPPDVHERVDAIDRALYPRFIEAVDRSFG